MSKKGTKNGKANEAKPKGNSFSRSDLKKAFNAISTAKSKTAKSEVAAGTKDDPIWRTIKNNSKPIKSGSAAYNLFQDQPGEGNFPQMNATNLDKKQAQQLKKNEAPVFSRPAASFAQADWSIGDAIRDRLLLASIGGAGSNVKPKPISNLNTGKLVDLDRSTADKFRRGKLAIEGRLDLHGHTQDESMGKLARFIEMSYRQGKRCLIIVTGKGDPRQGGGVLKRNVPEWLEMSPNREKILAISKAQPKDGGSGALYVLLKRTRG